MNNPVRYYQSYWYISIQVIGIDRNDISVINDKLAQIEFPGFYDYFE